MRILVLIVALLLSIPIHGQEKPLVNFGNKEVKKETKKSSGKFKITKPNGNIIYRDNLGTYVKVYESKGCKVEEV